MFAYNILKLHLKLPYNHIYLRKNEMYDKNDINARKYFEYENRRTKRRKAEHDFSFLR